MILSADMKHLRGKKAGVVQCEMSFAPPSPELSYDRADLEFHGVDHSDLSYDVRVFLNNRSAGPDTERTAENGYAGRFVIFGHGGCFGGAGHCSPRMRGGDVFEKRSSHALVPQTKIVTITHALQAIHDAGDDLFRITLVPYTRTPRRRERTTSNKVFKFEGLKLLIYSSA